MIKTKKNVKSKPKKIGRHQVELYDTSVGTLTNEQLYQNAGRSNLQPDTAIAEKLISKDKKPAEVKSEKKKKELLKARSSDWPALPPTLERILNEDQKRKLRDRMLRVKGQQNPFRKKYNDNDEE